MLIVDERNRVERRGIKTGLQVGQMLTVERGLTGNEWVVVEGLLQAVPGREVKPSRTELKAPPSQFASGNS